MRSKLFRSLQCLMFVCWRACAVLTNHTIDDTDAMVKYNTYKPNDVPVRCNSTTNCSKSVLDFKQLIEGTVTSVAGEITIPFTATTDKIACAFHIDGKDVGSYNYNVTKEGNILGYSNTSLPEGSHKLVIISEQGAFTPFDGLIYHFQNALTPLFQNRCLGITYTMVSAHLQHRKAVIIGSVVSGSVCLLAVFGVIFILLRRRSAEWRNLAVEQPFPINEEKEPASPVSNLADHLRRLEARFRRIEALAPGTRRASNGRSVLSGVTGRSSPLHTAAMLLPQRPETKRAIHLFISAFISIHFLSFTYARVGLIARNIGRSDYSQSTDLAFPAVLAQDFISEPRVHIFGAKIVRRVRLAQQGHGG
ncbi:hypothetical protein B0H13DRAFT_1912273 [Mycena leptocephala]|nr:hypothetical protein B0H13DRAFT_1912273 [Mycena leptocephala]